MCVLECGFILIMKSEKKQNDVFFKFIVNFFYIRVIYNVCVYVVILYFVYELWEFFYLNDVVYIFD